MSMKEILVIKQDEVIFIQPDVIELNTDRKDIEVDMYSHIILVDTIYGRLTGYRVDNIVWTADGRYDYFIDTTPVDTWKSKAQRKHTLLDYEIARMVMALAYPNVPQLYSIFKNKTSELKNASYLNMTETPIQLFMSDRYYQFEYKKIRTHVTFLSFIIAMFDMMLQEDDTYNLMNLMTDINSSFLESTGVELKDAGAVAFRHYYHDVLCYNVWVLPSTSEGEQVIIDIQAQVNRFMGIQYDSGLDYYDLEPEFN